MKKILNYKSIPWVVVLAGFLGMALRWILMFDVNDRGFVVKSHPVALVLLAMTGVVLIFLLVITRSMTQANKYSFNFPASILGAAGALLAAIVMGIFSVREFADAKDLWEIACSGVGLISALCLVFVAYCRKQGLHPSAIAHTTICIALMLRLICMYRQWSADPQLYDYCYQLLALVCAMLAAYHRATFDADFGHRGKYTFFSLSAVYFCIVSLSGQGWLFYLAQGCWLITDLCNLKPMPKELREEEK